MLSHHSVYCNYFGFSPGDFIPCEVTGLRAVDISHNDPRGMGGSEDMNDITNLMALTRELHDFLEMNNRYKFWFDLVHYHYMLFKKPYYTSTHSDGDFLLTEILSSIHGYGDIKKKLIEARKNIDIFN